MARDRDRGDRKKFKYHRPDPEKLKERAEGRSGGMYDNPVNTPAKPFKPRQGTNKIRILPPGWEGAQHYGVDMYVHYGVGPEKATYLCNRKHGHGDRECAVCDELARADREGDEDYARKLAPKHRVLVYLVDQKDTKAGVQFWAMPYKGMEMEILKRTEDKETGDTKYIDDPDDGFNVFFEVEGTRDRTKYTGVEVASKSTPISDDPDTQAEFLEFVTKNPLPDALKFFDSDYIAKLFKGGKAKADDDDRPSSRSERRGDREQDDDDRPRGGRGKNRDREDDEDKDDDRGSRSRDRDVDDKDEELDDDRPRGGRSRRDDDRDEDKEDDRERSRSRSSRKDDEDDKDDDRPRRTRSEKDENDDDDNDDKDDDRRSSRSSRDRDEDKDDDKDKDEERSSGRRRLREDDEDKDNDDDKDDDRRSSRSRDRDDDKDDDRGSRSRSRDKDNDDDEDDKDDDKPRGVRPLNRRK